MSTPNEIYYGTGSERAHLDWLAEQPNAAKKLSNYLDVALAVDRDWGTIDKVEVIAYARVLYANAMAKAATQQQLARVA